MFRLQIDPQDRLLIVAPHPDDESIGCGGLMLAFGNQTDILLITDGRTAHGNDVTDEECAAIRQTEFHKAVTIAGVKKWFDLGLPDGKAFLCGQALKAIDFSQYTKVFLPNHSEEHPDHRTAYEYVKRALRRKRSRAEVYSYEVWAPIAFATHYLDISSSIEQKDRLIDCYRSQLCIRDYHAMTRGLTSYRGVCCHTAYAEAYELITSRNRMKRLFFSLPIRLQVWIGKHIHKQ